MWLEGVLKRVFLSAISDRLLKKQFQTDEYEKLKKC